MYQCFFSPPPLTGTTAFFFSKRVVLCSYMLNFLPPCVTAWLYSFKSKLICVAPFREEAALLWSFAEEEKKLKHPLLIAEAASTRLHVTNRMSQHQQQDSQDVQSAAQTWCQHASWAIGSQVDLVWTPSRAQQQKAPQQQEQNGSLNLPVLAAGAGEHTADSLYKLHDFRSCCAKEEQLVFCVLCHGK